MLWVRAQDDRYSVKGPPSNVGPFATLSHQMNQSVRSIAVPATIRVTVLNLG